MHQMWELIINLVNVYIITLVNLKMDSHIRLWKINFESGARNYCVNI